MPNYDYVCGNCEHREELIVPYSERLSREIPCEICGHRLEWQFPAPTVMRASYVDGTKRKGWEDMRQANKLVKEAAVSKPETAREIRKEIAKRKVKVEK